MAIEFTESAAKHGFTLEDAVNAMTHSTFSKENFDASRVTGGVSPDLYVGPSKSGVPLEVMVFTQPPRTLVIFHVMELRPKFRTLMEEENND